MEKSVDQIQKYWYINLMFSTRKCIKKDCVEHAVTGSKYCFNHIKNPDEFMASTVAMLSDCDGITNFKFCKANISKLKIPCRSILTSKFTGTIFTDVIFDKVEIKLCFFDFCEFHNCRFTSADVRYSVFSGSVFRNCSFDDSEVLHTNFNGVKFTDGGFISCDLYYSSFVSSELQNVLFKDCNLKKVNYITSNRSNVSFKYSNWEEAEFDKGTML